jgi:hypothetical protein
VSDTDPALEAELEELADASMAALLVEFGFVRPTEDDIQVTEPFLKRWQDALATLENSDERVAALASLLDEPVEHVDIEYREADQPFGVVDNRAVHNWISEASLRTDLAAHRAVTDDRWSALDRNDKTRILRSFRVVLDTCPTCAGPVIPTEEVVESCCRDWDVIAVRCTECGVHIVELPPPGTDGDQGGSEPLPPRSGGFTR